MRCFFDKFDGVEPPLEEFEGNELEGCLGLGLFLPHDPLLSLYCQLVLPRNFIELEDARTKNSIFIWRIVHELNQFLKEHLPEVGV